MRFRRWRSISSASASGNCRRIPARATSQAKVCRSSAIFSRSSPVMARYRSICCSRAASGSLRSHSLAEGPFYPNDGGQRAGRRCGSFLATPACACRLLGVTWLSYERCGHQSPRASFCSPDTATPFVPQGRATQLSEILARPTVGETPSLPRRNRSIWQCPPSGQGCGISLRSSPIRRFVAGFARQLAKERPDRRDGRRFRCAFVNWSFGSPQEAGYGYSRILGELKKLRLGRISRQTVTNILKENGLDPGPRRGEDDVLPRQDLEDGRRATEGEAASRLSLL